jgi:hypothetical protein
VEPRGERVGPRFLGHPEAAGHDDAAPVRARVVPRGEFHAVAGESDLLTVAAEYRGFVGVLAGHGMSFFLIGFFGESTL